MCVKTLLRPVVSIWFCNNKRSFTWKTIDVRKRHHNNTDWRPQPDDTGWLKHGLVKVLTSTYSDKSGAVIKINK